MAQAARPARPPGIRRVARAHGPGPVQRREPARPARHRHQEPRLGRRVRVRPGARARGRRGAQQRAAADRRAHELDAGAAGAMIYSRVVGTGSYLPPRVMSNAEFAARLDTSDAWIRERTGIERRHIADKSQSSSDLALEASKNALKAASLNPNHLDLIIVATSTPDYVFPSRSEERR